MRALAEALAPVHPRELNIVAVAVGGLFLDLDYTMSTLDGSPWYGVEIGVVVAINRAYPQLDLSSLLNAQGNALAAQHGQDASGCAGAATNEPGGNASEFASFPSSGALAAAPQVENVLNRLYMEAATPVPTAPSFFYNAVDDELAHIHPVDQLVATTAPTARRSTTTVTRSPASTWRRSRPTGPSLSRTRRTASMASRLPPPARRPPASTGGPPGAA